MKPVINKLQVCSWDDDDLELDDVPLPEDVEIILTNG
jgi:hypothetical protein